MSSGIRGTPESEISVIDGVLTSDRCPRVLITRDLDVPMTRETFIWFAGSRWPYRRLLLDEFEDDHLLNVIRYLEGRGDLELTEEERSGMDTELNPLKDSFAFLLEEADRRGLDPIRVPHPEAVRRFNKRLDRWVL